MPRLRHLKIASCLLLSIGLTIGTRFPAQATPATPVTQPASPTWTKSVIETMAGAFGADPSQFKIVKMTPATWQDCPPIPDRSISGDCKPKARSGWRVAVKGKGETWQYLVTTAGNITLDAPASVSPKVRSALATFANMPGRSLRLSAVQLVQNMSGCPVGALCKMSPNPAWKILSEGPNPVTISLQGEVLTGGSLASFLPANLAGMPATYGDAVLQDVRDRSDGMLPANLRASVKAINWNECRGGDPAPSQPQRGICPDIDRSGWQMITTSGPMRWVHYLNKSDEMPLPTIGRVSPDGPQSLPPSIGMALMRSLAQRDGKPLANYRVYWADATFFDGCLNPAIAMQSPESPNLINPALSCQQRVQSGWQVGVMGNEISGGATLLTTYHVNATGQDYRLISQAPWFPRP
jgi:hypothetical protein